ncbi:hypothetical protein K443DRAFT_544152 [Laccaria amethystina LaAM-08-1]|uniref:GATA-type domain-containing protein n=1 Tax=Laccaria amethystina LaAM-08-1 TaxID=1095629 RepID=A0A0C9Y1V4_9AGAR|nr:hypothetical protein K443DRAFT_544152 [Laccaria amethystina LaAM-08-1]
MPMFGWDSKDLPEQEEKHQPDSKSDFAIDPALRNDSPLSSLLNPDKRQNNISSLVNHSSPSPEEKSHSDDSSMPHRVEPLSMSSPHRRHHFDSNHRLPSPPPPVTSLSASHSPSPSVTSADRSSVSTPVRRSPANIQAPPPLYSTYHHDPSMMQSNRHHPESHFSARAEPMHHPTYIYTHPPPPPFDPRYEHHHPTHSPYHTAAGLPHQFVVPAMPHGPGNTMRDSYGHPYPLPGQAPVTIMHTDDAATKLSDRVRRRCFNCCTTDTSTWRRSNLSPGKVLCNKCGLFERTHSRPRPDQFPHKRGPLATASLRTPPGGGGSLSSSPSMSHPNHSQQPLGQNMNQLPPISAPYHYTHTPLAPLTTTHDRREYQSNTLPALQAWHAPPGAGGNGNGSDSNTGSAHVGAQSSASSRRSTIDASPTDRPVSPQSMSSRSGNTSQDSTSSSRAPPPPAQASSSTTASRESAHDE